MGAYQFITGIHGNELMPIVALGSRGVPQLIANPKAVSRVVRFVDVDMNGVFGKPGAKYECLRATEILELIDVRRQVIDFHTFGATSPPFAIIVERSMLSLARKTGLRHVVYMKHNIKNGHALINYRSGISVEVGTHDDEKSFTQTLEVVDNLTRDKSHRVSLYEVYGVIEEPGKYVNFALHQQGFYPILAGSNAYEHYGLKARKVKEF